MNAPALLLAEAPPASIGHNRGPPLDLSFHAWAWRRAHAEVWETPGREIVLLRIRRAARLGLDYRAYTSVILDRGVHLAGLVVMLEKELLAHGDLVSRKLDALSDCSITLCAADPDAPLCRRLRASGRNIAQAPRASDGESLRRVVEASVAQSKLPPAAIFMVGTQERHRWAAERAALGLFVAAWGYFGIPFEKLSGRMRQEGCAPAAAQVPQ